MKKLLLLLASFLLTSVAFAQTSLPEGTALRMRLESKISTAQNKAGDRFQGQITEAVALDGKTVVPVGSLLTGRITTLSQPRRFRGKPAIGILPEALVLPDGTRLLLTATLVDTNVRHGLDVNEEGQIKGPGHDGKDLTKIGMGTGGGMLIGGLIASGPGVLIGGAIGGGATITQWLVRRRSATVPEGTELIFELNRPMAILAPVVGQ